MRRFDWNLIKSFLAVLEAGSLSGASQQTAISQPTLGRHIDELETLTGLILFERGRAGMIPTPAALSLGEEARGMRAVAEAFSMAAAGRELAVEGPIRITASEVVATYVLPDILVALKEAEPALEIELVATNTVSNLLARDADIAVRMTRPVQNDLIARKVNEMAIGAFAHRDYLARHGTPGSLDEMFGHSLVGYDRSDLIERGMKQLGMPYERAMFGFRTDDQVTYWELVKAGAGIGFGPIFIAGKSHDLVRIVPDLPLEPLPYWLASHRELKQSAKVRRVYDFLAEEIAALPLFAS